MKRQFSLLLVLCCACIHPAFALDPFKIKDIRVEGIQRTEAGTVFSYMPVKVGDTLDNEKAAATIKALFATGFFKDVRLEYDKDVLIVQVQERREHDDTEEYTRTQAQEALRSRKIEEEYQNWLRRLRDEAYVEYRLDDASS